MTFALYDTTAEKPHIPATWPTEAAAQRELTSLLRGYPARSEWRKRLVVIQVTELPARQQAGLAPSLEPEPRATKGQYTETPKHKVKRLQYQRERAAKAREVA